MNTLFMKGMDASLNYQINVIQRISLNNINVFSGRKADVMLALNEHSVCAIRRHSEGGQYQVFGCQAGG